MLLIHPEITQLFQSRTMNLLSGWDSVHDEATLEAKLMHNLLTNYSRSVRPIRDHTQHINVIVQMILTQVVDLVSVWIGQSLVDDYRKAFKNNFSLRPSAHGLIFWIYIVKCQGIGVSSKFHDLPHGWDNPPFSGARIRTSS